MNDAPKEQAYISYSMAAQLPSPDTVAKIDIGPIVLKKALLQLFW